MCISSHTEVKWYVCYAKLLSTVVLAIAACVSTYFAFKSVEVAFKSVEVAKELDNHLNETIAKTITSQLYESLKNRFINIRNEFKDVSSINDKNASFNCKSDRQSSYFSQYWHLVYDEWLIMKNISNNETTNKLWNVYYSPAITNALTKDRYLQSFCYLHNTNKLTYGFDKSFYQDLLILIKKGNPKITNYISNNDKAPDDNIRSLCSSEFYGYYNDENCTKEYENK